VRVVFEVESGGKRTRKMSRAPGLRGGCALSEPHLFE
jgi:hypothetical protein